MKLITLLQIAGLLHVGLLCAGALMPRVVGLNRHLVGLPPFVRNLMWVYYGFIGVSLACFGALSFFLAEELASGEPLARAVCAFLAAFWTARLLVALFVFDLQPYLTDRWRKLGYHTINIVFALLPVIYTWAAWKGGEL
ncbi:MAG TPA: hypothetical protein VLD18_11800 [Verrucomicrobiae bacterium]|nr:hypothetical protein [Verrucomicrobiae bacterium]